MVCHLEMRVEMPLFINRHDELPLKEFLFLSEDKLKVFYFNLVGGRKKVCFTVIDFATLTT